MTLSENCSPPDSPSPPERRRGRGMRRQRFAQSMSLAAESKPDFFSENYLLVDVRGKIKKKNRNQYKLS